MTGIGGKLDRLLVNGRLFLGEARHQDPETARRLLRIQFALISNKTYPERATVRRAGQGQLDLESRG